MERPLKSRDKRRIKGREEKRSIKYKHHKRFKEDDAIKISSKESKDDTLRQEHEGAQ